MYKIILISTVVLINKIVCENNINAYLSPNDLVNVVSDKFLSFTIDPKYLLSSNGTKMSSDCVCMISSLSPAYVRIAGPSTSMMDFQNASIQINPYDNSVKLEANTFVVSFDVWSQFATWANNKDITLVFALNQDDRYSTGIWNPNTALNIISVAASANITDIVWQLGYECRNQSIEDYLFDLETLRVMVDSVNNGTELSWRTVGSDITKCLGTQSKQDLNDYFIETANKMNFVFMNGNSTADQLETMGDDEKMQLLRIFNETSTPLWITESTMSDEMNDMERAVDWMNSLGYSAKNGFSVHFREINETEIYEPSLSFYMALLYKNLVGVRVLDVTFEDELPYDTVTLFAHCTQLKRVPIDGAVTLFGVNMDNDVTRFSLSMGSDDTVSTDIMQFVFELDKYGNILVNSQRMEYDGDIKPALKRVRPYRKLVLSLPQKSFGFWVLANTNNKVCKNLNNDENLMEAETIPEYESRSYRGKRSITDNYIIDDNNELNNKKIVSVDDFKLSYKDFGEDLKTVDDQISLLEEMVHKFHNDMQMKKRDAEPANVKKIFSKHTGLKNPSKVFRKNSNRGRRDSQWNDNLKFANVDTDIVKQFDHSKAFVPTENGNVKPSNEEYQYIKEQPNIKDIQLKGQQKYFKDEHSGDTIEKREISKFKSLSTEKGSHYNKNSLHHHNINFKTSKNVERSNLLAEKSNVLFEKPSVNTTNNNTESQNKITDTEVDNYLKQFHDAEGAKEVTVTYKQHELGSKIDTIYEISPFKKNESNNETISLHESNNKHHKHKPNETEGHGEKEIVEEQSLHKPKDFYHYYHTTLRHIGNINDATPKNEGYLNFLKYLEKFYSNSNGSEVLINDPRNTTKRTNSEPLLQAISKLLFRKPVHMKHLELQSSKNNSCIKKLHLRDTFSQERYNDISESNKISEAKLYYEPTNVPIKESNNIFETGMKSAINFFSKVRQSINKSWYKLVKTTETPEKEVLELIKITNDYKDSDEQHETDNNIETEFKLMIVNDEKQYKEETTTQEMETKINDLVLFRFIESTTKQPLGIFKKLTKYYN